MVCISEGDECFFYKRWEKKEVVLCIYLDCVTSETVCQLFCQWFDDLCVHWCGDLRKCLFILRWFVRLTGRWNPRTNSLFSDCMTQTVALISAAAQASTPGNDGVPWGQAAGKTWTQGLVTDESYRKCGRRNGEGVGGRVKERENVLVCVCVCV